MNKTIGKDIDNPIQREQFIKDNANGDLVELRPATAEELQPTLFMTPNFINNPAKDGTND